MCRIFGGVAVSPANKGGQSYPTNSNYSLTYNYLFYKYKGSNKTYGVHFTLIHVDRVIKPFVNINRESMSRFSKRERSGICRKRSDFLSDFGPHQGMCLVCGLDLPQAFPDRTQSPLLFVNSGGPNLKLCFDYHIRRTLK